MERGVRGVLGVPVAFQRGYSRDFKGLFTTLKNRLFALILF